MVNDAETYELGGGCSFLDIGVGGGAGYGFVGRLFVVFVSVRSGCSLVKDQVVEVGKN